MKSFKEIFVTYWDNIIIGIIAGLVLYYGLKIQSGIYSALYLFLFALILNFIYSFSVWFFQKKEVLKGDILQPQTVSKKESKKELDEKNLLLWKDVARDEYLCRRNEWTSTDSKLSSLLIIILAIFGVSIQFINFDTLLPSQKFTLGISFILFLISIILCFIGLWGDKINVINFIENRYDYKKELSLLKKQYKESIDKQNEKIDKKLRFFKGASILTFVGIFLIALIKLGVRF